MQDQDGCKSVTPSAASGSTLRFGNAIGNLICGGSLTTDDGNVKVTRLNNTDNESLHPQAGKPDQ